MKLAPIYIAACKRPQHLANLLARLKDNPEADKSEVTVVIGGPKEDKHWTQVKKCLEVAKSTEGFKKLRVVEAYNILTGSDLIHLCVDDAFILNEKVIILEEDLVVRQDFLSYMNQALIFYQDCKEIAQISGWNFGLIDEHTPKATYLFPHMTSWGWGTWKRAWSIKSDHYLDFNYIIFKFSSTKFKLR